MQDTTKNTAAALFIGFFLIILIAVVTIFRPSFSKNNPNTINTKKQDISVTNLNKTPKISNEDLAKKIQARDELVLLDIRPEAEYRSEHILNSQNILLSDINNILKSLDKNKTYVIIDSGVISESVATAINSISSDEFREIFYLEGGISGWKNGYHPTISEGDPNQFTDQSKVSYIQADELRKMMDAESNLTIIDVRKSNQFDEGHLENSINIFLDDLEKRKGDIPIGKKIILYDNDGLWAFKAAVRLFDMGFFNTYALSDGLDGWKIKNYELTK